MDSKSASVLHNGLNNSFSSVESHMTMIGEEGEHKGHGVELRHDTKADYVWCYDCQAKVPLE